VYATERLLQHYDEFDPSALRELLDHAPSVAGGSYLAKLWSDTVSHMRTPSEVSASASRNYWTEFRTDMLPLLTEMSKTDAQGEHSSLSRLRQLAEGTAAEDPKLWLPNHIYEDFFRFYINPSTSDEGQVVYSLASTLILVALVKQHIKSKGKLLKPAMINVSATAATKRL
jgi:hypothetical protein